MLFNFIFAHFEHKTSELNIDLLVYIHRAYCRRSPLVCEWLGAWSRPLLKVTKATVGARRIEELVLVLRI